MGRDFSIECAACGQKHPIGETCPHCAPPRGFWAEVSLFAEGFRTAANGRLFAVASAAVPIAFYGNLARGFSDPAATDLARFAKLIFQLSAILGFIALLLYMFRRAPRTVYLLVAAVWLLAIPGLYEWSRVGQ